MDNFILSKERHFVLYGAASFGSLLCDKLLSQGYRVDGFIDQRAGEIDELKGIPVYNLNEASDKFAGKEYVVIISVKNVFEHSRIAMELAESGLNNILYKPYATLKGNGTENERMIDRWYDKIVAGDPIDEEKLLMCTLASMSYLQDETGYLVAQESESITVRVPLVCLFENLDVNVKVQERNALYFFPHIQFFGFLQGDEKADPSYYMSYCEQAAMEIGSFQITDAWKKNVVKNRTEVCTEMNNSYYFEPDFFVDNAPTVIWNSNGYFNLTSGKHRTAFWASKKMMFMPVKINKQELRVWLNQKNAQKMLNKLYEEKNYELKAPIEHPLFYQYPCISVLFFQGLLFKLAEMISRIYYKSPTENYVDNRKIYISVEDWGLLSRWFRRCGAQVYEDEFERDDKIVLLDELFYLEGKGRLSACKEYDICIIKTENLEKEQLDNKVFGTHNFYIVPSRQVRNVNNMRMVYQGIAWGEKMCVVYQGADCV